MQRFCNSWRVRNILVRVLGLNKLDINIMSLQTRLLRPIADFCPCHSVYSTPRMSLIMPEKTTFHCPRF
jgi:hypothetical protein